MGGDSLPFPIQFQILLETHPASDGKPLTIYALAHAVDISEQTLHNLMDARSHSPRLETARRLCHFFGISLDYFTLESEAACYAYLAKRQSTGTLQAISQAESSLTPRGRRNVLTMMEIVRRALLP